MCFINSVFENITTADFPNLCSVGLCRKKYDGILLYTCHTVDMFRLSGQTSFQYNNIVKNENNKNFSKVMQVVHNECWWKKTTCLVPCIKAISESCLCVVGEYKLLRSFKTMFYDHSSGKWH